MTLERARSLHGNRPQNRVGSASRLVPRLIPFLSAIAVVAGGAGLFHASRSVQADAENTEVAAAPDGYQQDFLPFLRQYCLDCHGDGAHKGDFTFDRYKNLEDLKRDRYAWTKALKLLRVGAMPPVDADKPPDAERAKAVKWLDHQLFYCDCSQPQDPGHVTVRRLNKVEYDNTVRDLLGVDFHPASDFPSDDTGHGFDNIGAVLTVPPLLLEKYLDAAENIAARAVGIKTSSDSSVRYAGKVLDVDARMVRRSFEFPRAGKYLVRVETRLENSGGVPAKVDVRLGNRVVLESEVEETASASVFEATVDAQEGRQNVTAVVTSSFDGPGQDRKLHVAWIEVDGPLAPAGDSSHSPRFVRVRPEAGVSPVDAARTNLKEFLPLAFRRDVTPDEVDRFVGLARQTLDRGASFDEAMSLTLQAILVSPHFLFRVEGGRRREGNVEMLDDYALASRLSYFLWSSMPDAELFRLARQNELHQPETLKAQALRLLGDPRADALIVNFAGQWLGLRRLGTKDVNPDAARFPDFNEKIRLDLWKETELFFGSIVRNNSSIFELLTGRFTFLNERLARYYGIEGITGPEFRKFEFTTQKRSGVLTQGSVLTLTSHPGRTSPVKRGEWVLTNLLGDSPPDPPPSVPTLEDTQAANPTLTLKQQMERHRADPGCATCHKIMDGIGFGLENFDPIGRWREQDGSQPIDSTGTLPGGDSFNGPVELISILNRRKADFGRCLTEKMLTYALGRGVEWFDKCAVDEILTQLERDDRFATLIVGIVGTSSFQLRRVPTAP